jgi:hypothetical protein
MRDLIVEMLASLSDSALAPVQSATSSTVIPPGDVVP